MDEKAAMLKMMMKAVAIAMVPLTSWMNAGRGDVRSVTCAHSTRSAFAWIAPRPRICVYLPSLDCYLPLPAVTCRGLPCYFRY